MVLTLSILAAFAVVVLVGWWLLYRRASEARQIAKSLLFERSSELSGKFEIVDDLVDRASVLKQSSAFYGGLTAEKLDEALKKVSNLYLVEVAAKSIADEVEEKLESAPVFLSKHHYDEAIRMLKSDGRKFVSQDDFEELRFFSDCLEDGFDLRMKFENFEPFRFDGSELDDLLVNRCQQASTALEPIEEAIYSLGSEVEGLGNCLSGIAREVDSLAGDDFFPIPAFRRKLIPSLEDRLQSIVSRSFLDPCAAMESELPELKIRVREGAELVGYIEEIRENALPEIDRCRGELADSGLPTGWIRNELKNHGEAIDSLAEMACLDQITNRLEFFRGKFEAIRQRIDEVIDLSAKLDRDLIPQITEDTELHILKRLAKDSLAKGDPRTAEAILNEISDRLDDSMDDERSLSWAELQARLSVLLEKAEDFRSVMHLEEAEKFLENARAARQEKDEIAFRDYLESTGFELASATREISSHRKSSLSIGECRKAHSANRFRYRTVETRIEDRRTRRRTQLWFQHLGKRIGEFDEAIDQKSSDLVALLAESEDIARELEQFSGAIDIDWSWHDIATESLKHTARVFRDCPRSIPNLKQALKNNQQFLEEDHRDWKRVFQQSIELEVEVCEFADENLSSLFTEATGNFIKLNDWPQSNSVTVDREAADQLFDKSRKALAAGNVDLAANCVKAASQWAANSLKKAKSLQIERSSVINRLHAPVPEAIPA